MIDSSDGGSSNSIKGQEPCNTWWHGDNTSRNGDSSNKYTRGKSLNGVIIIDDDSDNGEQQEEVIDLLSPPIKSTHFFSEEEPTTQYHTFDNKQNAAPAFVSGKVPLKEVLPEVPPGQMQAEMKCSICLENLGYNV